MISCRSEGDPMAGEPTALVSTEWLAEHLHDPAIRIVDGTYFLPTVPRDAAAEFAERHIPGAVFFDIDAIKDHGNPLPHMLPEPAEFAARVGALGLGDETTIIAYDAHGVMSAARVWWMFRVMGHDAVAVLDGGLPKWLREGRPLAAGPAKPRQRARFTPRWCAVSTPSGPRSRPARGSLSTPARLPALRAASRNSAPGSGAAICRGPKTCPMAICSTRTGRSARPRRSANAFAPPASISSGRSRFRAARAFRPACWRSGST